MDAASPPEAGSESGEVVDAAAVVQLGNSAPDATPSLPSVDGDAQAAASGQNEAESLDAASSSDKPAPASVKARAMKLDDEVATLMTALRSGDTAAQVAAAKRVRDLSEGVRGGEPTYYKAACEALLAADVVTALRTPVEAPFGGDAAAHAAADSALEALACLADCYTPARDDIARDWPPVLCAIMLAEPSNPRLVHYALSTVWNTTRSMIDDDLAPSPCTVLCMSSVPAAVVECLRRILETDMPVEARGVQFTAEQREYYEYQGMMAVSHIFSNMCETAVPPSTPGITCEARVNDNAAAVFDAGAVPVLSKLLHRQLLLADGEWIESAIQALGWCVELSDDRDASATHAAVASLVALLRDELYLKADDPNTAMLKVLKVPTIALTALCGICKGIETRCEVLAEKGGVAAVLRLIKPKNLESKTYQPWIEGAVELLECVLTQSAACRQAFFDAGGFAAPVATLAASARAASKGGERAVEIACLLFANNKLRSPLNFHEAMCMSGAVRVLCSYIPNYPAHACLALWKMCEDRPAAAEQLRDCNGLAALGILICESKALLENDTVALENAVGLLMTLSNFDWLTSAIAELKLLEPLETIVEHEKVVESTRLYGLLAMLGIYSGRAEACADVLLMRHDISRHLARMLHAVLYVKDRLYMGCDWSALEVANYLRLSTVDAQAAALLAAEGIVPLLLELLSTQCDDTKAMQRQACRTLLNLSYAPSGRTALLTADAAAKVERFECVADTLTATAAKGLVARLAEGGADGDTAGVTAAAAAQSSFRVFLSHKRTDAKDFARGLHTFFKEAQHVSCFLDFEFKENLHDLGAVIQRCDNLIFILSDNVFDSKWCLIELCAAVRSNVKVIFVYKEGSEWGCSHTGGIERHPPHSLVDALELDPDVAYQTRAMLKGYKAVQHSDVYYGAFTAELLQKLATPEEAAEARKRAAADAAQLPQTYSTAAPLQTPASYAMAPPTPAPHSSPAPRRTGPKLRAFAAAHAAVEERDDSHHAILQELVALRLKEAAPPAPAARDIDARFYMFSMMLGGAVAAVAMTSCIAVVAVVVALMRAK